MKSSLGFVAKLVERQAADERGCTFKTRSGHFDRALSQPFAWPAVVAARSGGEGRIAFANLNNRHSEYLYFE